LASKGDTGATGSTGATGNTGPQGPAGEVASTGSFTTGNFAIFSDTTGDLIQDASVSSTTFALAAKGVTNGDSHNHVGGDGAQIDHALTSSLTYVLAGHTGTASEFNATITDVDFATIASPTFTGTVTTPAIKITTGAGASKVLTSDADGDATWETPASSGAVKSMSAKVDTGAYSSSAASLTEITTNWRHSFTPISTTSTLVFVANFSLNTTNSVIHQYDFYDVTNTTAVGSGIAAGSRRASNTVFRGPGADANDGENLTMMAVIANTSTTTRVYTIRTSNETTDSTTVTYFNQSNGDSSAFGWNTPFTWTITEI